MSTGAVSGQTMNGRWGWETVKRGGKKKNCTKEKRGVQQLCICGGGGVAKEV
jgi:hypothetical protein